MSIDLPVGFLFYFLCACGLIVLIGMLGMKVLDKHKPHISKAIRRRRFSMILSILIVILLGLLIMPYVLIAVKPGHVGVMWERFNGGTRIGPPFKEGTVLVMPWDKLIIYSSRFQTKQLPIEAVTNEGLKIKLDMVVRYRPVRDTIPLLHKLVGEHYAEVLIMPEIGSSARQIVSGYTAEHVYTDKREEIQTRVFEHVVAHLRLNEDKLIAEEHLDQVDKFIHVEDVMIRDIVLPEKVDMAIINKVNQNYLHSEYTMRLKVAKKEAERKATEADGIAAFQERVSGGISETYLRWRGIEATIELAKSNNAKVVVIGSGKDGLPLILNTEGSITPNVKVQDNGEKPEPADRAVELNSSSYNPAP